MNSKEHWCVLRFCFTFWLCWTKIWLAHVTYENAAHNLKKCKQMLISLILFLLVSGHLKSPHCKQKNSKRLVFTFKKNLLQPGYDIIWCMILITGFLSRSYNCFIRIFVRWISQVLSMHHKIKAGEIQSNLTQAYHRFSKRTFGFYIFVSLIMIFLNEIISLKV